MRSVINRRWVCVAYPIAVVFSFMFAADVAYASPSGKSYATAAFSSRLGRVDVLVDFSTAGVFRLDNPPGNPVIQGTWSEGPIGMWFAVGSDGTDTGLFWGVTLGANMELLLGSGLTNTGELLVLIGIEIP